MRIETGSPLLDAVRNLFRRPDVEIDEARHEPLEYDAFLAHRTVNRVRGTAIVEGDRITWSMIEKITEGPATASPYLVDNAVREFTAYTSGLLEDLAPGVRAPRLLAARAEADGRLNLWIEEIPPQTPRPLDAETLLDAARDLGTLAGRWAGRIPRHPWLFTGWIDRHSQPEAYEEGFAVLGRADPKVMPRAREAIRLLREQGRVRSVLEALPQTLCHHDAVGANVFRVDGTTVLIDWESVGAGPVGADLASLLVASAKRGDCSAALAVSVVEPALAVYTRAVRLEAPSIETETVRRGFDASIALRWKLVRDVAESIEQGSPVRRGSAPGEAPEDARIQLEMLFDPLFESAGRALGW